jgi:hypothetical protein
MCLVIRGTSPRREGRSRLDFPKSEKRNREAIVWTPLEETLRQFHERDRYDIHGSVPPSNEYAYPSWPSNVNAPTRVSIERRDAP